MVRAGEEKIAKVIVGVIQMRKRYLCAVLATVSGAGWAGEKKEKRRKDRMLSLSPRILCCVGLPISRCISSRVMSLQSSPGTSMVNLSCIVSHHTLDPWVALWQTVISVTLCCIG